jgi:hypothetical protein
MNGQHTRFVNLDMTLKTGRDSGIEFWRDNGDGTCTRVDDGLTLSYERYDALPGKQSTLIRAIRQQRKRLHWDA